MHNVFVCGGRRADIAMTLFSSPSRRWALAVFFCLHGAAYAAPVVTDFEINVSSFDSEFTSANREAVRRNIQLAALAWHARAGGDMYFRYVGDTTNTSCSGLRGLVKGVAGCHPTLGCGVVAERLNYCGNGGEINVYLGSGTFVLSYPTQPSPAQLDFQSVLAHEFGHTFYRNASAGPGFDSAGHLPNNPECIMYPSATTGQTHTPCDLVARPLAANTGIPRAFRKTTLWNSWGSTPSPPITFGRNLFDFSSASGSSLVVANNKVAPATGVSAATLYRGDLSLTNTSTITSVESLRRAAIAYDDVLGIQWAFVPNGGYILIYRNSGGGWIWFDYLWDPTTAQYVKTRNPISAVYHEATSRIILVLLSDTGPAIEPCPSGCRNEARVITLPGTASSSQNASALYRFGQGSSIGYAGTGTISTSCKPGVGTSSFFQCEVVQTGLDVNRSVWGWSFGINNLGQLSGYSGAWPYPPAAALGDIALAFNAATGLQKSVTIRGYDSNIWSWRATYNAAGAIIQGGYWSADGVVSYRGPVMKWSSATVFAPHEWNMFLE